MFAFLLTLLILDALLLSVVVLLQAGQGGGLASLGGATTDTVLGGRQAVTLLTKATWWCGGIGAECATAAGRITRVADGTRDGGRARTGTVSNHAFKDALAGSSRSLPAEEVTAIDGGVTG